MNRSTAFFPALVLALGAAPAGARAIDFDESASVGDGPDAPSTSGRIALPPYLQCVPYARQVTGISIYGDAHTWWGQAEGRYARGQRPKVGAVMAFKPHGNSSLGHVAAVSRIVDDRTILVRHANWSPINGRRGQIEDNVRVIDVSEDNDWSEVRVWYAPIQALGGAHWPIQGFIYPTRPGKAELARLAAIGGPGKVEKETPAKPAPAKAGAGKAGTSKAGLAKADPISDLIGKKLGW